MAWLTRGAAIALLALPGALVALFGFNAGGFFPGLPALVAFELALVLVGRSILAARPFAGFGVSLGVAAGALALFALWQLASGGWSHAPGAALIEADRTLLYLITLVLFGSLARRRRDLRWMLRGVAAASVVVCSVGLVSRLLPHVWPSAPQYAPNRLGYPVTYWNALGLLAAVGIVLCLHLTSSERESRVARVLGAAAIPPLASTLLLTFSRGAIGAGVIGVAAYVLIARPRGLAGACLSAVPAGTIAVLVTYHAGELASLNPTSPAAIHQGHRVALVVGACIVGSALMRWLLLGLDSRLEAMQLDARTRHRVATPATIGATLVAGALLLAFHAPEAVGRYYHGFVHNDAVKSSVDTRKRLTDPSSSYRIQTWGVALDGYKQHTLHGWGAGTYENLWDQQRPINFHVRDGHSLYVEVLAELGLAGLLLLLVALGTILFGFAWRARGPDRALYGALLAVGLTWAVHAGFDWDWEMPVVTIGFFALGGTALAVSARHRRPPALKSPWLRGGVAAAAVGLAVLPLLVTLSQRHLDDALAAFTEGNCSRAIAESRSSWSVLGSRPEPYEMAGYCEARAGKRSAAIATMQKAVDRNRDFWEYRYGLALVKARAGVNPLPDARAARRLNPLEPLTRYAILGFERGGRRSWKRHAMKAPFPIGPESTTLTLRDLKPF